MVAVLTSDEVTPTFSGVGETVGTCTVGAVARESGVTESAVRFYERQGLVTAGRTAGNQRRFANDAACRIKLARVAQRVGLTVSEIRDLFAELPVDPGPADWEIVGARLAAEAERRIVELRAALAALGSGRRLCEL